jgi:hypothetical protein
MSLISPIRTRSLKLNVPPCTVGITDGSERGDYVPQEHVFNRIGRPHHVINLMFQYYPDMENWPTQGTKRHGFYRHNDLNKGDGYFPLVLEEGGPWGQAYLRQIEEVRAYGQDAQLTLTLHPNTPEEDLIRIAKSLEPFGRMRIRINHECNGTWFYFNQRWSYGEVSDGFIRFHNILHEHAPEILTVACWNGKGEAYTEPEKADAGGQLTEDQLAPMFRTADIVSYDQYASLHWGWPDPDYDRNHPKDFFDVPFEVWWELLYEVHDRMCDLRGGETPLEIHEINEDADVIGIAKQAEWTTRFYRHVADLKLPWLTNITFYMFRDRGGLGLEQEDVDDPSKYEEMPALKAYSDAIGDPYFDMRIEEVVNESPSLRWKTATDAQGYGFTFDVPSRAEDCALELPGALNLLVKAGDRWYHKPAGVEAIEIGAAQQGALEVAVFAPPADGRNNSGEDYRIKSELNANLRIK